MAEIQFESIIAAPLAKVWAFHDDVKKSLPAISPPKDEVKIESADSPIAVGSRITLTARGPFGSRIRWTAKIIEHSPPHAVVFGEEARFVDEQEAGPFKSFRHAHEFERIDEKTTRAADRVKYSLPFGPLGWIADRPFVRPRLRAMFRYRHAALKRILEL